MITTKIGQIILSIFAFNLVKRNRILSWVKTILFRDPFSNWSGSVSGTVVEASNSRFGMSLGFLYYLVAADALLWMSLVPHIICTSEFPISSYTYVCRQADDNLHQFHNFGKKVYLIEMKVTSLKVKTKHFLNFVNSKLDQ